MLELILVAVIALGKLSIPVFTAVLAVRWILSASNEH